VKYATCPEDLQRDTPQRRNWHTPPQPTASPHNSAAAAARGGIHEIETREGIGVKPGDNPALEQWRDGRDWRYNTEYIFGVTRGLKDQNIPPLCEGAAWIVTVPFDIANLPFTVLAGLFGD